MLGQVEYIVYSRRTDRCHWEREFSALTLEYALRWVRTVFPDTTRETALVRVPWGEMGWGKRRTLPGVRIDLESGAAV